ncbi:uncharacterized protein LOC128677959 [Plodia interpunctella]|uniref:uncharacterized protein LOC128677959 n=1 Tax=Plodia interpunctella TaxID=58824 RepID=UPI00236851E8|nr:uncharacterized protein LOC128677959 [Plodia interpunctella]
MKISECKHIRIRDNNAYGVDPETLVRYIETQYDMDIRSLPYWKEIIKRFQVSTTDCKRIIQNAKRRKHEIIQKLYVESTRLSPFQLTDNLVRTGSLWKMLEGEKRRKKIPFIIGPEIIPQSDISERSFAEQSELESGHQNTEQSIPNLALEPLPKSEPESEAPVSHLPVHISTNLHELVGPSSTCSYLSHKSEETTERKSIVIVEENAEWKMLPESTLVRSVPNEIVIEDDSLEEQVIKFSIVNCGTEYIHIKFVCVTEKSPFRYAKIIPKTPGKIYPGLSIVYKLIFKVVQNEFDFESSLYFRIGQIVLAEGSTLESLCIPVKSNYLIMRNVSASEAIYLPPVYSWHLGGDYGYPTGYINVSVLDNFSYKIHITKVCIDFDDTQDNSTQPSGYVSIENVEMQSVPQFEIQNVTGEVEYIDSVELISPLVFDIVEASLEPFWVEYTYLHLSKLSHFKIPVYLTKIERIGSHHACYDIEFFDSFTENKMFTKTVKVFGEILAHPIQIHPPILDMSNSPVLHGFCEDKFVIVNTHKFYLATIKIKMTTKMKKLLRVSPMEVAIPQMSSVSFDVRFCSPGLIEHDFEDLVHFTVKIIVSGYKAIYHKVPPFYYEIIAPCIGIYEKVYKKKKVET